MSIHLFLLGEGSSSLHKESKNANIHLLQTLNPIDIHVLDKYNILWAHNIAPKIFYKVFYYSVNDSKYIHVEPRAQDKCILNKII